MNSACIYNFSAVKITLCGSELSYWNVLNLTTVLVVGQGPTLIFTSHPEHWSLACHRCIKMSITTPPDSIYSRSPFYFFLISPSRFLPMLQLATSLLHSVHHLLFCPTQLLHPLLIEMGITISPDSLFLLSWTGGAEGKQSSRIGSVWLTSKEDHAVRMLSSLHFNLQPAGKAVKQDAAIHHIHMAAPPQPHNKIPGGTADRCQLTNANNICSVQQTYQWRNTNRFRCWLKNAVN